MIASTPGAVRLFGTSILARLPLLALVVVATWDMGFKPGL
jgi:hypothetical protein